MSKEQGKKMNTTDILPRLAAADYKTEDKSFYTSGAITTIKTRTRINFGQSTSTSTGSVTTNNASQFWASEIFYGGSHVLQGIVVILLVLTAYLACVTSFYLYKYQQPKLKLSNFLLCFASILLFAQCCWFQPEVVITSYTYQFCIAYSVVNIILATVVKTTIYVILWIRQNFIYSNPLLTLVGKHFRVVGKLVLFGMVIFAALQLGSLIAIVPEAVPGGCILPKLFGFFIVTTPLTFCMSLVFQVALLLLTLYPVLKHIRKHSESSIGAHLRPVAIRLCVCTGICVATDMLFLVGTRIASWRAPINFVPVCYAFDIAIHIAVTLCSFVDYQRRLWPFCKCEPHESTDSSLENSSKV